MDINEEILRLAQDEQREFNVRLMNELRKQADHCKLTGLEQITKNPRAFAVYMTSALTLYGLAIALGNTLMVDSDKPFVVPPEPGPTESFDAIIGPTEQQRARTEPPEPGVSPASE